MYLQNRIIVEEIKIREDDYLNRKPVSRTNAQDDSITKKQLLILIYLYIFCTTIGGYISAGAAAMLGY